MKKLKNVLDVTTNVAVVVFAVVAIGVLAKNHLAPRAAATQGGVRKGSTFPEIAGADYRQARRTLVLALNVDCRYCTRSIHFYNRLAEARREHAGQFSLVAAFINKDEDRVKSYVEEKQLAVQMTAGVDLDKLGITTTPTIVLLNEGGKVLDSWRGALQADGEREVFEALGVPYEPERGESTSTAAGVRKTVDIFDEQKAVLSIRPLDSPADEPRNFVEVFDVSASGDAYLLADKFMFEYDAGGRLKNTRPLPPDFRGPFCVGDGGNIYAVGETGLSVFSPDLVKVRDVPLGDPFPRKAFTLRMAFDRGREAVYIQAYTPTPLTQALYRLDLKTRQIREVHRAPNPVRFNPTYSPGAFGFAVGEKFLYVSDIRDYKVFVYSPADGSLVRTITRPHEPQPIGREDGRLPIRKVTISGVGEGEGLRNYPPIFHLNYTEKGNLLVWTSRRDATGRQVVDVFDGRLRHVGTDLKFTHPGRSSYVFLNRKVYVPDYGFGKPPRETHTLSPLEIPAAPLALKVFDASL